MIDREGTINKALELSNKIKELRAIRRELVRTLSDQDIEDYFSSVVCIPCQTGREPHLFTCLYSCNRHHQLRSKLGLED